MCVVVLSDVHVQAHSQALCHVGCQPAGVYLRIHGSPLMTSGSWSVCSDVLLAGCEFRLLCRLLGMLLQCTLNNLLAEQCATVYMAFSLGSQSS